MPGVATGRRDRPAGPRPWSVGAQGEASPASASPRSRGKTTAGSGLGSSVRHTATAASRLPGTVSVWPVAPGEFLGGLQRTTSCLQGNELPGSYDEKPRAISQLAHRGDAGSTPAASTPIGRLAPPCSVPVEIPGTKGQRRSYD